MLFAGLLRLALGLAPALTAQETSFLSALIEGFAAFGGVVGFGSAALAFAAWAFDGFDLVTARIGQALNLGVAATFILGSAAGLLVFDLSYTGTL
jgi:hypothetical protein